jgi:ABC-2 type transport system permease protein
MIMFEQTGKRQRFSLFAIVRMEFRKMRRSPIFLITIIGMVFMPLMLGLLMFIKKYPALAKSTLLLSKASMIPGNADWLSYLGFFSQMIGGAGLLVFGFCASWLFGREYSDKTVKDLLALPLPRGAVVWGKFIVLLCWCVLLFVIASAVSVGVGMGLQLPGWTCQIGYHSLLVMFLASLMNVGLNTVTSFMACWTRGYLAPIGFIIVALMFGNFTGMLGFAAYYPWAIPMTYATKALEGVFIGIPSVAIVVATAFAGLLGTLLWWRFADQH